MATGPVLVALLAAVVIAAGDGEGETKVFDLTCGPTTAQFSLPKNHKIDKFRLQDFRRILLQLGTARSFLEAKKLDLQEIYGDVTTKPNTYSYSWLPEDHLRWFKEKIQCLDKYQKAKLTLPLLYTSLQNFSATFDVMRETREHRPREELIKNLFMWLRAVLCEVEFAMINMDLAIPKWQALDRQALGLWFELPSDETLQKEGGVHDRYSKFLEDWNLILRDMVRKKRNKACLSLSFVSPTSASNDSQDYRYETEDASQRD